jgi:hypothetical protein
LESEVPVTKCVVAFFMAALLAAPLAAQKGKDTRTDAEKRMQAQGDQDSARLQKAMQDAQKTANHSGDNKMSCDDLEADLIAQMQAPTVKKAVSESDATATQLLDDVHKTQGDMKAAAAGSLAMTLMMGVVNTMVPGMSHFTGKAEEAAGQAMKQKMEKTADAQAAETSQLMNNLAVIMPNLYRSNRVMELGRAKNCEWAQQAAAAAGMPPGGGTGGDAAKSHMADRSFQHLDRPIAMRPPSSPVG